MFSFKRLGIAFIVGMVSLQCVISDTISTEAIPTSTVASSRGLNKEQFSVGPFLRVFPVRVRSDQGEPLLAFYMINSSLKPKIEILMDSDFTTSFDFSIICRNRNITMMLQVKAFPGNNLQVSGNDLFPVSCQDAEEHRLQDVYSTPLPLRNVTIPDWTVYVAKGQFTVTLRSGIIGIANVEFSLITINDGTSNKTSLDGLGPANTTNATFVIQNPAESTDTLTYTINVVRKIRPIDKIFRLVIYTVQIFVAMGFGCKLDLNVVKECLVRPIAPGIGLGCQYILMPLIAFAVAKAVPIDIPAVSLGIFVTGCCPGGGASNMYSYLLRGDLSLSITMTALSTILALGMLPFWLYTLGTQFSSETGELNIPFEMVAVSLSILIVPLLVGLFLRQKFPKIADKIGKALKPVILVMSLILLGVGIYSNLYIFRLFKPRVLLARLLLPYVGYASGGIVAFIFRQPWTRIKTISLETGMQNTSIGFILLINSFPAPVGDIAAVGPVASAVMTPLPPFTITIFYLLCQRFCNKNKDGDDEEKGEKSAKNGTACEDGADEKLTAEMTSSSGEDELRSAEKVVLSKSKV